MELCSVVQAGPTRFYCAAEGCTVLMTTDAAIFCVSHDAEPVPIKNAYSVSAWRNMIHNTRARERQQGWIRNSEPSCTPQFDIEKYYAAIERDRKKHELLEVLNDLSTVIDRLKTVVKAW